MYNILVIGSGGREHCIIKNIYRTYKGNSDDINVYCFGSHLNPGIKNICKMLIVGNNLNILESYISKNGKLWDIKFDFAIIGPEAYINEGYADFLEIRGIFTIAPTKKYGKIEASKIFARNFIRDFGLNEYQPDFRFFVKGGGEMLEEEAYEYAYGDLEGNFVLKNNELAGGKGVKLSGEHIKSEEEFINDIKHLKNSGYVIEEKLEGEEFSLLSFCDGKNLLHMPCVKDFKKAYEGDYGPNTGGMGTISYANGMMPFLNDKDIKISKYLNESIVEKLKYGFENDVGKRPGEKERGYIGILYGSYMKTKDGLIKIIEYNCRFGDPEVLNILSLLETSLLEIFLDIKSQSLDKYTNLEIKNKYSVCKYLVPIGYPVNSIKNCNIYFEDKELVNFKKYDIPIYFGSVYENNVNNMRLIYNSGSRCIAYVGIGDSLKEAWYECEDNIKKIIGNMWYRKDIGLIEEEFNYQTAGVNIDEGNKVVEGIKNLMKEKRENNIGNFGGIFSLDVLKNKKWYNDTDETYLVSSIDGVGTKVILSDKYKGEKGLYNCGKDLVYHGINDILVMGAHPLFFLDYYGCQKLVANETIEFVRGINDACSEYDIKLVGGETAEMNSIYNQNMKDLVGVIIGGVNKSEVIDGSNVGEGNYLYSISSNGPHTNGYSLIRKILDESKSKNELNNINQELIDWCCQNHTCYYKDTMNMQKVGLELGFNINGLCHITGGGFYENLERIIKKDKYKINLEYDIIKNMPNEFKIIQKLGNVKDDEMIRVLNCGVGFVFIIDKKINLENEEDKKILNKFNLNLNYLGYISKV